jgi:hypothetical protein
MPFDSTPTPVTSPAREALDDLLESLGPNGENWCPYANFGAAFGAAGCVLQHTFLVARRRYPSPQDVYLRTQLVESLRRLLQEALPQQRQQLHVDEYNDGQTEFGPIRDLVNRARARA